MSYESDAKCEVRLVKISPSKILLRNFIFGCFHLPKSVLSVSLCLYLGL